jgi:hypothetical protein
MKALSLIVASLVSWAGIASAQTITITTMVYGTSGPWKYVNGGLNTAYEYAHFDFTSPTVISAGNGFRFFVGDGLTIRYLSGLVAPSTTDGSYDANGETSYPLNNYTPNYGLAAPSYYINHSTYPIYCAELVGTFADSSGQIVGTPFAIGDSRTLTIPTRATQLQLGVNDDMYVDNSGSWNIQITGVPEPKSLSLVAFGVFRIIFLRRRSS